MNALDLTDPIASWLVGHDSRRLPLDELVFELMRLVETDGIHLARFSAGLPSRHPQVAVRTVVWLPDEGLKVQHRPSGAEPPADDSPLSALHAGADELRLRLAGPGADLRFPVCRELASQGATDYLLQALPFSDQQRGYLSWATVLDGGFSDEQLGRLRALTSALSLRFELESARFATECLLATYLGPTAARQALAGVSPAEAATERAVIALCSLRGFDALAAASPARALDALGRFSQALLRPVLGRGGEVHRLTDGAALVTFPVPEGNDFFGCQRALVGCGDLLASARQVLPEGLTPAVALHIGEVLRGVVGALPRLDFMLLGAALDETRATDALGASLGEPLVTSHAFALAASGGLESLGMRSLGSGPACEIFRPQA